MAQHTLDLRMRLMGFQKAAAVITNVSHRFRGLTRVIDHNVNSVKRAERYWQDYFSKIKGVTRVTTKATQSVRRFRGQIMGIGFAALFGGMALYRVFGGALRSLFQNYKEVMDETSEFNQKTNQLSGAWTFFKSTLIDALMQTGLFQAIIGFIINLVNGIAEFTSKHPELTSIFMIFMSIVAAVGLLAMVLGQPILMLAFMGNTATIAASKLMIGFAKAIVVIAILAIAIWAIVKIFNSDLPKGTKVFLAIGVAALALAGIFLVLGMTTAALWFSIIAGIALVIGVFYSFKDTIKNVWDLMINYLADKFIGFKITILKSIEKIIHWLNKIPWINIGTSGLDRAITKAQTIQGLLKKERIGIKSKLKTTFETDKQNLLDAIGITSLREQINNSNLPKDITGNKTKDMDLSKEQLEAQKISNEYAQENANNSSISVDILSNMDKSLKDIIDFKQKGVDSLLNPTPLQ